MTAPNKNKRNNTSLKYVIQRQDLSKINKKKKKIFCVVTHPIRHYVQSRTQKDDIFDFVLKWQIKEHLNK